MCGVMQSEDSCGCKVSITSFFPQLERMSLVAPRFQTHVVIDILKFVKLIRIFHFFKIISQIYLNLVNSKFLLFTFAQASVISETSTDFFRSLQISHLFLDTKILRFCSCALAFSQKFFHGLSHSCKNLLTWAIFQPVCE